MNRQPMTLHPSARLARGLSTLLLAVLLAACAAPRQRAPVEERSNAARTTGVSVPAGSSAQAAAVDATKPPPPGAENAGKPGYYTVKPGDTMIRVGLESGQNWRDVARWNNIENPNLIEVGQVLRVVPPGNDPNAVATRAVAPVKVEARPLDAPRAASAPASAAAPAAAASTATPREADDEVTWAWPTTAAVSVPFDEVRTKGLVFAGKAGDPVLAAADGRVVYAGSGLRGYGNLLIIKHNNSWLTAYAHNQTLLVKDEQPVKRGQKIAEMGSSDADRVQLHFEIRRQGKPIDPLRLLPPR
jgi:lipoprotein NlpD